MKQQEAVQRNEKMKQAPMVAIMVGNRSLKDIKIDKLPCLTLLRI